MEVIRLVSLDEWGPAQVDCLQEAGFDVSPTPDGDGVRFPEVTEPGLVASLNEARYRCELEYPVELKYVTPLSNAQLEAVYEYRTGDLIECLEEEGFRVASDAPSETVFIESGGAWSPYGSISSSTTDIAQVRDRCPEVLMSVYDE